MKPEITFLYTHNTSIGYGRMGVMLSEALRRQGVTLYDDLGVAPDGRETASERRERFGRDLAPSPTNVTCWASVPTHARWWYKDQYTSVFTMWEAQILPETFRDTLYEFDLVIVPSEQNLELFGQYHDNVVLNPLGVDPERWHYIPRPEPENEFRFLIGGSGARKGTDLASKAFLTVFGDWKGDGPEPVLVMKNPKGEQQFRFRPRHQMVSGRLSSDAESGLYAAAHCYVQPSRGEGFGLQPLQAMAMGIPTILTNAHGHSSFAKYADFPLDWSWSEADYFIYGHAGDWWEPDFEQLCEAMWEVYHNYEPHRANAEQVAKNVIPKRFTWDHCADRFIDAHGTELEQPYRGDGSYKIPIQEEYLVRVLYDWPSHNDPPVDIAGVAYRWKKGTDYYENADIKRILFERGVLDPSCLEGEGVGLVPVQMDRVNEYSGNKEWCDTCRQQLNTKPSRADWIELNMENESLREQLATLSERVG